MATEDDSANSLGVKFDALVKAIRAGENPESAAEQMGHNGLASTVEWPRLEFVRVPRYSGSRVSSVFEGERLPTLDKMPGQVLHGWRDLNDGDRKPLAQGETVQRWPHEESLADGHRWDSVRARASSS